MQGLHYYIDAGVEFNSIRVACVLKVKSPTHLIKLDITLALCHIVNQTLCSLRWNVTSLSLSPSPSLSLSQVLSAAFSESDDYQQALQSELDGLVLQDQLVQQVISETDLRHLQDQSVIMEMEEVTKGVSDIRMQVEV